MMVGVLMALSPSYDMGSNEISQTEFSGECVLSFLSAQPQVL